MYIRQLSIFVENRQGRLAEITSVIGQSGVDIRALSIADTTDFGILRIIVNNPEKAEGALREANMTVKSNFVIGVEISDKPGALSQVLEVLSKSNITIEYLYAFITKKKDTAYVILRVEDNDAAAQVLHQSGIRMVDPKEIYED